MYIYIYVHIHSVAILAQASDFISCVADAALCDDGSSFVKLHCFVVGMPHVHSSLALSARRDRAVRRGFLKAQDGYQFLEVRNALASKVRAAASSLSIHTDHCARVGRNIHFANNAALAARQLIGEAEFATAKKVHQARNAAMHKVWNPSVPSASAAVCGESSLCGESWADVSEREDLIDPLSTLDPWATAVLPSVTKVATTSCGDPWGKYLPPVAPPCSVGLNPATPPFLPNSCPIIANHDMHGALALIEAQNSTIAFLSGELEAARNLAESVSPSLAPAKRGELPVERLVALERDIKQLSSTLGDAIQASINERFAELLRPHLPCFAEAVSAQLSDQITSCLHELSANIVEKITSEQSNLLRKYDATVQKQFSEVNSPLAPLSTAGSVSVECASAGDILTMATEPTSSECDLAPASASDHESTVASKGGAADASADDSNRMQRADPAGPQDSVAILCDNMPVVLHSLSNADFNGQLGTIMGQLPAGRLAVHLLADRVTKSFLPKNLRPFAAEDADRLACSSCESPVNLLVFPPCDCTGLDAGCPIPVPMRAATANTQFKLSPSNSHQADAGCSSGSFESPVAPGASAQDLRHPV